ncbi:MAG: SMC-Scp complex subunit ScpB [Planctomycetes bacterium]|nr:SMC-Scp complex subunit ScpB [Planctomycetota bacterium]
MIETHETDASDDSARGDGPHSGPYEGDSHHQGDSTPSIEPVRVVEAILFASDSPLPASKIANILGVGDARDVKKHIAALNAQYESVGVSFRIEEIAGGFQMMTLSAYNTWLTKLLRAREETKLSPASLETLAIVAYKQPATRADIETIRGVAAGDMLNRLRELNLVKIVGRAEDLGRPLLYGTTKHFLEVFGLGSLEDLPQVEVLKSPGATPVARVENPPETLPEDAPSEEPPQLRIAEGA